MASGEVFRGGERDSCFSHSTSFDNSLSLATANQSMGVELTKQETDEAIHSLKRYFTEELDADLGDLRAKLLLDYLLKEIAPLAYNRGVHDAGEFFRQRLEDLPATCFEPALSYWQRKRK